jgi:hypothetical protein
VQAEPATPDDPISLLDAAAADLARIAPVAPDDPRRITAR